MPKEAIDDATWKEIFIRRLEQSLSRPTFRMKLRNNFRGATKGELKIHARVAYNAMRQKADAMGQFRPTPEAEAYVIDYAVRRFETILDGGK